MRQKRLLICLLIIALCVFVFAACSKTNTGTTTSPVTVDTVKTEVEKAFAAVSFAGDLAVDSEKSMIAFSVENEQSEIDLSAVKISSATLTVNGSLLRTLPLAEGENTFSLSATNGLVTATYTLVITRKAAPANPSTEPTVDPQPTHTHTYASTWSKDEFYHWHAATCEHTTEVKDKAEHDWQATTVNPATEWADGFTLYVCSVCSVTKKIVSPRLKHDHTYGDWTTYRAASCTKKGEERSYCSACGNYQMRETPIDPNAHILVHHEAQAAGCTEIGWDAYDTCSNCSYTTYEEIAALGHSYVTEVIAPTCTENGFTSHTCLRCGDTYADNETQAHGHSYAFDSILWTEFTAQAKYVCAYDEAHLLTYNADVTSEVTTDPTCESAGIRTYTATYGSHVGTKYAEIPATGHTSSGWLITKDPTCTEKGSKHKICTVCLAELETQEITALGHDLTIHPAQAVSCLEIGWDEYETCSRCGHSTYQEIAALGHDYNAVVTPSTCTEGGFTTHTCSRCNDTYTDSVTAPLGHDPIHHDQQAPTCTEIGWAAYDTCSRCNYTTYEAIAALGHAYEPFIIDPKCTEKGYTAHVCSRCDDTYKDTYTDSLGHNFNVEVTEPTCTKDGYSTYACTRCDYYYVTNVTGSLGHDYNAIVTPATCTEGGFTTHTCSHCGGNYVDGQTNPLGHDLEYHAAKAPTCTVIGYDAYDTCSRCSYTTYHELPALGHTEATDEAVAPTCTESGLTEGKHCSVCGVTLLAQEVVPAKGHSYGDFVTTTDPTCTEEGEEQKTCSVCGNVFRQTVPALGHAYDSLITEPTCTEKGYTKYICSRCDDTHIHEETAPLGHNYQAVVTEPTCTNVGYTTYTCSRCNDSYVDDITAPIEHDWQWVIDTPATELAPGVKHEECVLCHETRNLNTPIEPLS